MESKIKKIIVVVLILIILLIIGIVIFNYISSDTEVSDTNNIQNNTSYDNTTNTISASTISTSDTIEVLPTLLDEITSNSAWCGTFQLVWNDMQNEVVGQDIVFTPQLQIATNLNQQTFTQDDISEEYYFKTYGLKTLDLKEQIENGILEKFNQTSDILNSIDWNDTPQNDSEYDESNYKEYLFYVMLYREFTFAKEFDTLDNDTFEGTDETYEDIEYFGIDGTSSESLYSQNDTLKVPNIDFNIQKSFDELTYEEAGSFYFDDEYGEEHEGRIINAIQSIEFSLDETGGSVKSESGLAVADVTAAYEPSEEEYRYFEFDSMYNLFLVEDGKDIPYLALDIDDITLFQ